MANWSDILDDVQTYQNSIDRLNTIRQEYLEKINSITGRNVISYYVTIQRICIAKGSV